GGESRWPPALALLGFLVLTVVIRVWLPGESFVRVPYLVPSLEAILLLLLIVGEPGNVARHRRKLRRLALALVVLLVLAGLWSTAPLVADLIRGTGVTNSPRELLASGALVWLGNNLGFGLLYWLIDSGGPTARSHNPLPVDFAFTQQLSPELAPPGWRPVFL